jgi:hypothetical protein
MKALTEILAFALANGVHEATPSEMQGWNGAEGKLYLAEQGDITVVIDVCEDRIGIEVHDWRNEEQNRCSLNLHLNLTATEIEL